MAFDGLSMLVNVDTTLSIEDGRCVLEMNPSDLVTPGAIIRRWGPRAPPSQGAVLLGSRLFSTGRPGERLP